MKRKCLTAILAAVSLIQVAQATSPATAPRTVHVFVALADNHYQGIVPVPGSLGNGFDPKHNLYWGADAGIKTYFARSAEWRLLECTTHVKAEVMERCIFGHRTASVYLVADAYRGDEIHRAILDFLDAAAGNGAQTIRLSSSDVSFPVAGGATLVAYVGHDGLMDFQVQPILPRKYQQHRRDAVILACASKQYFSPLLKLTGAYPLLWTTNLMAPEAYTLKSALDGWIAGASEDQIYELAATAYDKYQKCGLRAARKLFATGW